MLKIITTTCPVTGKQPTRMPEESFRRMCARMQEREDNIYCRATCEGKILPSELEFIETTQGEENMGSTKTTSGECQLCGKSANLRNCLGKNLCASCDFTWRSINNRPESVLEALCEKMGVEWMQERVPAVVQVINDGAAPVPLISAEELAQLRRDYAAIIDLERATAKELAEVREDLIDAMGRITHADDHHESEVERLSAEIVALRFKNAELNEQIQRPAGSSPSLDSILLDLALKTMGDDVSNAISTLRARL